MLQRIDFLINHKINFAFETTLTSLSHIHRIKKAKSLSKEINFLKKQQETAEGEVLKELQEQTAELEKQRDLIVDQLKNAIYNILTHSNMK